MRKTTERRPDSYLEEGKRRKRQVINKARDEESLEEIKEYIYLEDIKRL